MSSTLSSSHRTKCLPILRMMSGSINDKDAAVADTTKKRPKTTSRSISSAEEYASCPDLNDPSTSSSRRRPSRGANSPNGPSWFPAGRPSAGSKLRALEEEYCRRQRNDPDVCAQHEVAIAAVGLYIHVDLHVCPYMHSSMRDPPKQIIL